MYYYFTKAEHALQAIERRRLKCADLESVNDPLECMAGAFNNRREETYYLQYRKRLSKHLKVICLSKTYSNPLLWGHYANSNKGICLGFDVECPIIPVEYKAGRVDLTEYGWIRTNLNIIETENIPWAKLLSAKHRDWKYEKEYRIWEETNKTVHDPVTGHYFFPFSDYIKLREILVGFQCDVKNIKSRLNKLIAGYSPKPRIYDTRRSLSTFAIEKV